MSIFSDLKVKTRANRNAFDLSQRTVFSNKPGVIRPCLALHTLPSSEYEIDMAQLMRTQPLQTAAFTGASINYDFVFVPYNYLYSSFNEFIAQREDAHSSTQPNHDTIPSFNLKYFLGYVLALAAMDYLLAQVSDEDWQKSKNVGDLSDYYLDGAPRYLILSAQNTSYSLALSCVSMLDMLGYGNFLPVVKQLAQCYVSVCDEYVKDGEWIIPRADIGDTGTYTEMNKLIFYIYNLTYESQSVFEMPQTFISHVESKLYNLFGFNWSRYLDQFGVVSLWPVLAYNKAFYEYYRNEYYDNQFGILSVYNDGSPDGQNFITQDVEYYDYVQLFNLDDQPDFSSFTFETFLRLLSIFSEKLHLYKRDQFTGVLPSTQFGNVSTMSSDSDIARLHRLYIGNNSGTEAQGVRVNPNTSNLTTVGQARSSLEYVEIDPAIAISILEARQADAMQRFRERMLRSGNKTKDVFEAHGWSRPKSQSAFEPVFLGSFDGSLDINTVAATTSSDDVELGQLGANGVSVVRGNRIHFNSSDFGVILCLQYIVKAAEYDAYGIDKLNTLLDPFDFPYPEFQNISLVPISQETLNVVSPRAFDDALPASSILGYLARSFEYKTAYDKVHGEFYGSNMFPYANNLGSYAPWPNVAPLGVFADWVTTRKDTYWRAARQLAFHYIQIDCLDNIFKLRCTSDPATDPFLFNVSFDIKAVQPLPVIGLPI